MKFRLLFSTLLMVCTAPAWSATHEGVIAAVHVNGTYVQRGTCILMQPALDGTQWACVYKDSNQYKEITAMLFAARLSGVACTVQWTTFSEENHKVINYLQC